MSRRALPWVAVLAAWAAGPLLAAEPAAEPPPAVGVETARLGGAEVTTAVVPGRLLAVVATAREGGGRDLFLLVEPEGQLDAPRILYRLRAGGAVDVGELEERARDLPAAGKALDAVDLDGDGTGELLLGALGALYSLGPVTAATTPPPRPLLRHAGFDLRSLHPGGIRIPDGEGWIAAAETGALRLWRATGGALALSREIPLPVQAAREPSGLRLETPRVHALRRGGMDLPLFAVGPEAVGSRRLRSVLLDPGAPEGEARNEAWSLLPAAERVEQSWYALVDGRPVLFAATQTADRVGIFEKRLLRVFPLRADRTRAGRRPSLEVSSQTQRWFGMDLEVADVDGDGRQDLVLLQPEGLGGGELLIEAYPGIGGGRFVVRSLRSKLDPAPQLWRYGEDLSGDGRPDLVAVGGGALRLYPGASSRRRVVEKKPLWSVPLPAWATGEGASAAAGSDVEPEDDGSSGFDDLVATDLSGDGSPELLLLRTEVQGRGLLVIVRQPSP